MVILKNLKWRLIILAYLGELNTVTSILIDGREKKEDESQRRYDKRSSNQSEAITELEDGGGQKPRNAGSHYKVEQPRKGVSSLEPLEGTQHMG